VVVRVSRAPYASVKTGGPSSPSASSTHGYSWTVPDVTWITIRLLETDSVTVKIDVNTDDLLYALGSDLKYGEYDPEKFARHQEAAVHYLLTRLNLRVDNRALRDVRVRQWKRGGLGPEDDLVRDSAAFWDTTHVYTLAAALPHERTMMRVSPAIFPEFGVQTIADVSVYWHDTLIERRWLTLDRSLRVPLAEPALDSLLERARDVEAGREGVFGHFTVLGFAHILPYGLDHILFVLGLFFFSTRMKPLLFQVTAFTVAHSITLALSVLGIFALSPAVVEPLIALSIVVVGIENVFFRKVRASRWLVVFAFGLLHGMGFAGVLHDLGLPEGAFWPALIGFNLGVELGQIAVIMLAFALTVWFRGKPWYFARIVVPASLAISAAGLAWLAARLIELQ
jgi:hypothetical protein